MKFTSCYNCQERRVGCHAECERYLSEAAKNEQELAAKNKQVQQKVEMNLYKRNVVEKTKRRCGK